MHLDQFATALAQIAHACHSHCLDTISFVAEECTHIVLCNTRVITEPYIWVVEVQESFDQRGCSTRSSHTTAMHRAVPVYT